MEMSFGVSLAIFSARAHVYHCFKLTLERVYETRHSKEYFREIKLEQ